MNLAQVEVFLVLAEELHFGRTADRLYISQARVSRLVASLERDIGGTLFHRTSRRVRLTPLGVRLRSRLEAGYQELHAALNDARTAAQSTDGVLRIGFTAVAGGEAFNRLVGAFEAGRPECRVVLREVEIWNPYGPLRDGVIDVLVDWLAVDEPDLTIGPAIDRQERALAMAVTDPLAGMESVSVEDLADRVLPDLPPPPRGLSDHFLPVRTPSGRLIPRNDLAKTMSEMWALVARGRIVHPTVSGISEFLNRQDIVLVPIRDMTPLSLGPIWCTGHENARIRSLAEAAATLAVADPCASDIAPCADRR